jgi:trk system potassium uptake protein TrkH
MRFVAVVSVLSRVLALFAASMILPWGISWLLGDGAQQAFAWSLATTLGAAILLWLATLRERRELQVRDGFLLVALVWTVLPAFATLPLLLSIERLSFTDAYFEAVSGLTASGATVLAGLDRLPASINIWRGLMIWLGGMGVIVLAVAILPLLGVGGSQLFKAETPTPMKDTKLTPRIAETAKGLWLVYVGFTVACILAYWLAGMTPIDALMHGFTTMGLGGFSTHDASYAHWDSPAIEAVAMAFMLVAAINFATHFLAWRRFSPGPYRRDPEAKAMLVVLALSILLVAGYLFLNGVYEDFATALRYASFNVVSIATTTGYANTDYGQWPIFAPLVMLFLSSFVSCSGSTGSGMKMIRAQILFKQIFRELLRTIHPRIYNPVKLSAIPLSNATVFAVLAYLFMYTSSIIVLTLLLTASGLDVISGFSAAVASLNNTGPGLGEVGPATTYANLTDPQTWICSFAMLLVVFTPAFWRK